MIALSPLRCLLDSFALRGSGRDTGRRDGGLVVPHQRDRLCCGVPQKSGCARPRGVCFCLTKCQAVASQNALTEMDRQEMREADDRLSQRPLDLDPAGYFILFVDLRTQEIVAQHFRNMINSRGLACDPETGEVIPCDGSYKPKATKEFRGRTAKQMSVDIVEQEHGTGPLLTMLSHANYLGRELQKAEEALLSGSEYVQD